MNKYKFLLDYDFAGDYEYRNNLVTSTPTGDVLNSASPTIYTVTLGATNKYSDAPNDTFDLAIQLVEADSGTVSVESKASIVYANACYDSLWTFANDSILVTIDHWTGDTTPLITSLNELISDSYSLANGNGDGYSECLSIRSVRVITGALASTDSITASVEDNT